MTDARCMQASGCIILGMHGRFLANAQQDLARLSTMARRTTRESMFCVQTLIFHLAVNSTRQNPDRLHLARW